MLISLLTTALAVHFTSADYSCLCSYHVERQVYATPDVSSSVVGYLYEFDCKQVVGSPTELDPKWAAIAFEHKMSFVLLDSEITKQVCPGSPSPFDAVTTSQTTLMTSSSAHSSPRATVTSTAPTTPTSKPPTQSSTTTMQSTTFTTQSTKSTTQSTKPTTQSTSTTHSTPSTTPSTKPTTPSMKPTKQRTTSTTQSTTPTTQSMTSTTQSTTSTTQSTTSTTQSTTPTTQSTTSTTQSTTSTTQSTTPTTQSTTSATQSTKPTTQSMRTTSTASSTTQTTTPTTQTTTATVKAKTTTVSFYHLLTTHNKQTTTDWTIVPWSTGHHQYQKTTHHAPYHHKTTHRSSHFVNHTVNVGNLSLCPRAVVRLQDPGSRNLRQHGQYCYELRRTAPADWFKASKDCFSYSNGFIVQIMSQKDQDFIMQFLREEKVNVPIWIGLNDKGHEEHFFWDSGARLTYTNWDPQRKDNEAPHGQEDCGILKTDGRWDDTICRGYLFSDHHHPWICQYHVRHHGR